MMVDTRIYGYVVDGDVIHVDCVQDGDTVIARLYYLDDEDPHGMSCGYCGDYIFDPVEIHPVESDGTCEYGCSGYCGEVGEGCELHEDEINREARAMALGGLI